MIATGIPPHIILANGLVEVREESLLINRFQVNGVLPVTKKDVEEMVISMRDSVIQIFREGMQNLANNNISSSPNISPVNSAEISDAEYATFIWCGRYHPVPDNFSFPK
jgi:hypothetical protein